MHYNLSMQQDIESYMNSCTYYYNQQVNNSKDNTKTMA
jgi:hypothetical protein